MAVTVDIARVARLANLKLSPGEAKLYRQQLSQILDYVDQLKTVETTKVKPTFQVIDSLTDVSRPDETQPCLTADQALAPAPKKHNGYFITAAVLK